MAVGQREVAELAARLRPRLAVVGGRLCREVREGDDRYSRSVFSKVYWQDWASWYRLPSVLID